MFDQHLWNMLLHFKTYLLIPFLIIDNPFPANTVSIWNIRYCTTFCIVGYILYLNVYCIYTFITRSSCVHFRFLHSELTIFEKDLDFLRFPNKTLKSELIKHLIGINQVQGWRNSCIHLNTKVNAADLFVNSFEIQQLV